MKIYSITNLVDGKKYIGQTKYKNPTCRFYHHKNSLNRGKHSNKHLQYAWTKYGQNNFIFEIIECLNNIDELDSRESYWINFYKTLDSNFGYNLESGGNANKVVSMQTRLAQSKAHIGKVPWNKGKLDAISEETRRKISSTLTGNIPWNARKTRVYSDETIAKMSKAKLGKGLGSNNPAAKAVICLNNDKIYKSIVEAARDLNIPANKIGSVCRGTRSHTYGFKFKYESRLELSDEKGNAMSPHKSIELKISADGMQLMGASSDASDDGE